MKLSAIAASTPSFWKALVWKALVSGKLFFWKAVVESLKHRPRTPTSTGHARYDQIARKVRGLFSLAISQSATGGRRFARAFACGVGGSTLL
jgi:hypothetical protein